MEEFLDQQTERIFRTLPELDNTTVLTLKDLPYIRMAMIDVSARWYNIGIHFGIPTSVMDKFRSKNRNDPDSCLTCVLAEWLKNWNRRLGPPTWRKVIMAVSSRVGGDHPAQACTIAKEYKDYGSANSFKDSDRVDNRPLTSNDLQYVVAVILNGVASSWTAIGLFLGIPYKCIEIFKLEDTLDDQVSQMVGVWLGRKYECEVFGEPTWRKLAEAVAARSGGCHQRLASEIARDHPLCYATDQPVHPIPTPQSTTPVTFSATATSTSTPSALRNPELLTEADLSTLMNLLGPVAYRWQIICLQLGVCQSDLNNISANPMKFHGAPKTFFQDALHTWLQKHPDMCTITVLCGALRSESVGEEVLAYSVETSLRAKSS